MKNTLLSILVGVLLVSLSGCNQSQIESSLPVIRLSAAGGTAYAVQQLHLSQSDKQYIYDISIAINSVSTGNVAPTVAELQTAIGKYVTTPGAQAVGSLVTMLYQQYYPQVSGNGKLALEVLQSISLGVQDGLGPVSAAQVAAAKPYRSYIVTYLYMQKMRR